MSQFNDASRTPTQPTPGTIWVDDHQADLGCDFDAPGPDGKVRTLTLAAKLEAEAEPYETGGPFDLVIRAALRRVAADARARGLLTAEDYRRAAI